MGLEGEVVNRFAIWQFPPGFCLLVCCLLWLPLFPEPGGLPYPMAIDNSPRCGQMCQNWMPWLRDRKTVMVRWN